MRHRDEPRAAGRVTASTKDPRSVPSERTVRVPISGGVSLDADLNAPAEPMGIVLFAHGAGSSRRSPRNRAVAGALNEARMGTLLLDLLTPAEEREDSLSRALRFDIPLLAGRLVAAIDWLEQERSTAGRDIGLFGASTGAAAALVAAADRPAQIRAVVSRGGRPDLAGRALEHVRAPTLLLVGGKDTPVIPLNRQAGALMKRAPCELHIIPGASHLFSEAGALEEVAREARRWFDTHLGQAVRQEGD